MGHRLPTILGKAIDDVIRTLNEQSVEGEIVDLIQCVDRMHVLMVELSESAKLRPIIDGPSGLSWFHCLEYADLRIPDGEADVALWNKEIARYFRGNLQREFTFGSPNPGRRSNVHERPMGLCRSIQVSPPS